MGDIPFYVGLDSADVWAHRENFLLDQDGRPTFIAGVPPDYFSATGQRWGNPIYDWKFMKKDKFTFWIERLSYMGEMFDVVRVDHFRAFDTYWRFRQLVQPQLKVNGLRHLDMNCSIHYSNNIQTSLSLQRI